MIYKSAEDIRSVYKAASGPDAFDRILADHPDIRKGAEAEAKRRGVTPKKLLKDEWKAYLAEHADRFARREKKKVSKAVGRDVLQAGLYGGTTGAVVGGLGALTKHPALLTYSKGPLKDALLAGFISAMAATLGTAAKHAPTLMKSYSAIRRVRKDVDTPEPRSFYPHSGYGARLSRMKESEA